MKKSLIAIVAFALLAASCSATGETATTTPVTTAAPIASTSPTTAAESMADEEMAGTTFTVIIENASAGFPIASSGTFTVPDGAEEAGPALPGDGYTFDVYAAPGQRLSFATMLVQSNDLFFSPGSEGLPLYDGDNPISGDVTDQIALWDAGTEIDQPLGSGADQAPRQTGPDTGALDEVGTVRMLMAGERGLSDVSDLVAVTVTPGDGGLFTIGIANVSEGSSVETPLAPGVYVVHGEGMPLFTDGAPDRGDGLEALAEDGDPSVLAGALDAVSGTATPVAPGVYVVHGEGMPLFTDGAPDRGDGLEALAEDGNPGPLSELLTADAMYASGVFDTPVGAAGPGPALPGDSYSLTFTAAPGDRLSLATMFVQSNDWFYATSDSGLPLFEGETPISGDITDQIFLWDAGTEADQMPGFGPDQAPRQTGANTGADEGGVVTMLQSSGIKVTISSEG